MKFNETKIFFFVLLAIFVSSCTSHKPTGAAVSNLKSIPMYKSNSGKNYVFVSKI